MNEPAPLAEADMTQLQGLTLEDLDRLHGEPIEAEPNTLEMSAQTDAPLESAIGFELQAHAGHTPDWDETAIDNSPDQQLRQALVLSLESGEIRLDQKDDLRQLGQSADKLFQTSLPGAMQRLSQYLHAREQSDHLYERLAELSSRRGAAMEIIQTAKQIEQMEKVLSEDKLDSQEIFQLEREVGQLAEVLARYQELFRLARELA